MNNRLLAIVIVIVILVGLGAWFLFMKPAPTNNSTVNNATPLNVSPTHTNTNKNQTNNTTNITAAKAKELAGQYVGMGVTLETPTLTTYKGVTVWKVPVVTYSPNKAYLDPIYINAKTGQRVT